MSDQTDSANGFKVDIQEDDDADFQRRQYCEQIYESYNAARAAVAEMNSEHATPASRHRATVMVCDLLRLIQPFAEDQLWKEKRIVDIKIRNETNPPGDAPAAAQTVNHVEFVIIGLNNVLAYERPETAILPQRALTTVLEEVTELLYEKGILTIRSGEAEAKDGGKGL